MAQDSFSLQEVRQLLELALRYPDPNLAGLALRAAMNSSASPSDLLGDAVEASSGVDISTCFHLMRRYGRLDLALELLGDPRSSVREATAGALRWIHDASVPAALDHAAGDEDAGVRGAALKSLESVRLAKPTIFKPL